MRVKHWAGVLAMGVVVGACLPRESASGIDLAAPARATKGLGLYDTIVIEEPEDAGYQFFASQVAMHGTTLVVSADFGSNGHDVLFYELVDGSAVETFRAEGLSRGLPHWGNKIAVHGDHAASVAGEDAHVFKRVDGAWEHTETITEPPNDAPVEQLWAWASSVAIGTDGLFVGAPEGESVADGGGIVPGSLHEFALTDAGVGSHLVHYSPSPQHRGGFGGYTYLRGDDLYVLSRSYTFDVPCRLDIYRRELSGYVHRGAKEFHGSSWASQYVRPTTFGIGADLLALGLENNTLDFSLKEIHLIRRDADGDWFEAAVLDPDALGVPGARGLTIVGDHHLVVWGQFDDSTQTLFFDASTDTPVEVARIDSTQFNLFVSGQGDALIEAGWDALRVSRVDFSLGSACDLDDDCTQGFCRDGVCCDSTCGDGDLTDCLACSVAMGATVDGVCAPTTGNACDDGDGCTLSDACVEGACTGVVVLCEDQNPCTVDVCANDACEHVNVDDETPCPGGKCFDGKCVSMTPVVDAGLAFDAGRTSSDGGASLDAGAAPTDAGPVRPPTCTCDASSTSSSEAPWPIGVIALAFLKKRRQPSASWIRDHRAIETMKDHA